VRSGHKYALGEVLRHYCPAKSSRGISDEEVRTSWIIEHGGVQVYSPAFVGLVKGVRSKLNGPTIASFSEMAFSRLIPVDAAERFGIISAWPSIVLGVHGFAESSDEVRIPASPGTTILDPVQCVPFYCWLEGSSIPVADLPVRVRELMGGWSYRNERVAKLRVGGSSVEFLREEFVFLGTARQVRQTRIGVVQELVRGLKELEIEFRLVVGVGCFEGATGEFLARLPGSADIWDIPVLDLEARIPESDRWLEIAGCSLWGNRLTQAFGITAADCELHSACCGVGLSRTAYALLAQRGSPQTKLDFHHGQVG
jgi:seryl-tRNA synthetase